MHRRNFVSAALAAVSSLFMRPPLIAAAAKSSPPRLPEPISTEPALEDGFEPIRSPKRFRIVSVEWAPNQLIEHYHDFMQDAARKKTLSDQEVDARGFALHEAYHKAKGTYANPENLLAIPPHMQGESEIGDAAKKLLTRDDAIQTAAKWNQECLDEFNDKDGQYLDWPWFVVFEHGKTKLDTECLGGPNFVFNSTGWGREFRDAITELRLVRPTDDEIARYGTYRERTV